MRVRNCAPAAFILLCLLAFALTASAQEKVLYNSPAGSPTASDLLMDNQGNIYGMTIGKTDAGAGVGTGTVFELSPATGGGYTEHTLYSFGTNGGSDGAQPVGGLVVDGHGNLYGTTISGGVYSKGTVFELSPPASGSTAWTEKILYSFGENSADGIYPNCGLVMDSAGVLYGVSSYQGAGGAGDIYKLQMGVDGVWNETILYSFPNGSGYSNGPLVLDSGGNLYGGAYGVASKGYVVFKLSPQAEANWKFTMLYSNPANYEDYGPSGHMAFDSKGNLYGTTNSQVFELTPTASGNGLWKQTILYDFDFAPLSDSLFGVFFDGAGNLYGAAGSFAQAGAIGGFLYELSPVSGGGWSELTLYNFGQTSGDVGDPYGNVIRDGSGNFYGTGYDKGASGAGGVYEVNPNTRVIAQPTISPDGGSIYSPETVSISDATPETTIYYTIDGSTPTVDPSEQYSQAFTVSETETVKAIAVDSLGNKSGVALTVFTLLPPPPAPPTPVIVPAGGSFTSPQTVEILDSNPYGFPIYYTLDGTTPTSSSTRYTGPITLSQTATLKAVMIDVSTPSVVASASFNVSLPSTAVNYPSGGFVPGDFVTVGPKFVSGNLQLTAGVVNQAHSVWHKTKLNTAGFITDFTFQQVGAGEGLTFAIQNQSTTALGSSGGGLGYQGIANSFALKFDLYDNAGEGNDSTGVYTGGAAPTVPATNLAPSLINLHSGDVMHAHVIYSGQTLTLTITDTQTSVSKTQAYTVNIPQAVGADSAYFGFTAGTGSAASTQTILSWSYSPQNEAADPLPTPLITPLDLAFYASYGNPPAIVFTDAAPGAVVYYTLDGSTPTTSSLQTAPNDFYFVPSDSVVTAVAIQAGHPNSAPATMVFTDPGTALVDLTLGAVNSNNLAVNGVTVDRHYLQLTDGGSGEAHSIWTSTPVPISSFVSEFEFVIPQSGPDGFTFTIQNSGPSAVGAAGGGLGYQGIANSVAIKFDLYNNGGEGSNSTGIYVNGASPTLPASDLTAAGIDLHSGHYFDALVNYDGKTLTVQLMDIQTQAKAVFSYQVNIPLTVGSTKAYVGFTGATEASGGAGAIQNIRSWSYSLSNQLYVQFDVPGAVTSKPANCQVSCGTNPVAINRYGVIAGTYLDPGGIYHGFLRSALGVFTTVDYPGSTPGSTTVLAFNNAGTMLGYFQAGSGPQQYFLRDSSGNFTALTTYPDIVFSDNTTAPCNGVPAALNDNGTILGSCSAGANLQSGFETAYQIFTRTADGKFTTNVNYTDAYLPTAINDAGTITGTDTYFQGGDPGYYITGFFYPQGGSITDFYTPDSYSYPSAINASGVIAGEIVASSEGFQTIYAGFVRAVDGTVTIFKAADYDHTGMTVASVNASGEIAGSWYGADYLGCSGYLRDPQGNITLVEVVGASTMINSLNDWGVTTGNYSYADGLLHGFVRTSSNQ